MDQNAWEHSHDPDPYGQGRGMVWPYGEEVYCNLEGQYLHLVSDLTDVYNFYEEYK